MTDEEYAKFAPFAAINEFMRPDFRMYILVEAIKNLNIISEKKRQVIVFALREQVKIPGFRNPLKAPLPLKVKSSVELFEKSSEFASAILFGWMEVNHVLALKIYDLLSEEGWQLLGVDVDRSMLPGFFTTWPENYDFDVFLRLFVNKYPEAGNSNDEISLMIVLVSMRLPYDFVPTENQ